MIRKSNILYVSLIGLSLSLLVGLPIAGNLINKFVFTPRLNSTIEHNRKYQKEILADLEMLEATPLFSDTTYQHDAQEFLTSHVSWAGNGFKKMDSPSHLKLRIIMKNRAKLTSTDIEQMLKDPLLQEIDTTWMAQLHEYDHWSFSSHPQLQSILQNVNSKNGIARIGVFASLPIPDFLELRDFSIVHFLQQHAKGESEKGLRTMRHVAALSHSAGILISQMVAVSALQNELKFSKLLNLQSDINSLEKQIWAYKRVSWGWGAILQSPFYGNWKPEFEKYLKPKFGVCAGAFEQVTAFEGLKDFFETQAPFEVSFQESYARQRPLQKQVLNSCHLQSFNVFFSDTPSNANPLILPFNETLALFDMSPSPYSIQLNWARIPYVRRYLGLNLMIVAIPNWTSQYENQKL